MESAPSCSHVFCLQNVLQNSSDSRCLEYSLVFTMVVYVVLHSETQESDIQLNPGSFMQNMQKMFGECLGQSQGVRLVDFNVCNIET